MFNLVDDDLADFFKDFVFLLVDDFLADLESVRKIITRRYWTGFMTAANSI
jgi:hypothetical protein